MTTRTVEIPQCVKAVVFDWDGTVVDSVGPKLLQNQAIAYEFGNPLDLEQVRTHWVDSAGFPDLLSRLTNGADFDEVMAVVRRDYANPAYAKRRFEFAEVQIQRYRQMGLRTALLTNATNEILQQDALDLGLELSDLFDYVQTVDMLEFKKPDMRVLEPTLRALALKASEIVYIGDEIKDHQLTQNAGAHFIGVETGMSSPDEFNKAGAVHVPTLEEIYAYGTV